MPWIDARTWELSSSQSVATKSVPSTFSSDKSLNSKILTTTDQYITVQKCSAHLKISQNKPLYDEYAISHLTEQGSYPYKQAKQPADSFWI